MCRLVITISNDVNSKHLRYSISIYDYKRKMKKKKYKFHFKNGFRSMIQ